MPSGWFNQGVYEISVGATALESDTIKAMLLKTTYAFDRDDQFVDDVVAHECDASGYARITIGDSTLTLNQTADAAYWTANDAAFGATAAGNTLRYCVLFKDTGNDATSPLLACWQIVDHDTDGLGINVPWSANGLTKFWSAT